MHQSGILKAELDKLFEDNAARAKKLNIEITFEFYGHKYTVKPFVLPFNLPNPPQTPTGITGMAHEEA